MISDHFHRVPLRLIKFMIKCSHIITHQFENGSEKRKKDTKRENNENDSKNRNISIVDISAEAKNPPGEMFGV